MITRDLFFESGSIEATKIKEILQRYVIYISDQITVLYLNTVTEIVRLYTDIFSIILLDWFKASICIMINYLSFNYLPLK